jgi:hypothetical protein
LGKTTIDSLANSQQVLPLAKLAFEPHALGDLKGRDDAALDLFPTLSGALASYGPDQTSSLSDRYLPRWKPDSPFSL